MYKDRKNEWRWGLYASNGRIVADSGEGYKRRNRCRRMIEKLIIQIGSAQIEEK